MECKTFSHIGDNGRKVYKSKVGFDTLDDAIFRCKQLNADTKQITKLVSYKCKTCCKYHIGRNGKTLTDKYKAKLNAELDKTSPTRVRKRKIQEAKDNGNMTDPDCKGAVFKVVGKIDLSKIRKK